MSTKKPSFFKANFFNARIVNIHPKVDEIYIFPSKSIHSTSPNKTNEERISISADISIITKESENIENLITPIDKDENIERSNDSIKTIKVEKVLKYLK